MVNEFKSSCCTCEQYLSCTTCNKCEKCKVCKCLPKNDYDYKDFEYFRVLLNYYTLCIKKLDLELKYAVMFITSNKKGSGTNDKT